MPEACGAKWGSTISTRLVLEGILDCILGLFQYNWSKLELNCTRLTKSLKHQSTGLLLQTRSQVLRFEKKEDSELADQLARLEFKAKDDCTLILRQVEQLEDSDSSLKISKEKLKQHKKLYKKIEGLLRIAVSVKLHY